MKAFATMLLFLVLVFVAVVGLTSSAAIHTEPTNNIIIASATQSTDLSAPSTASADAGAYDVDANNNGQQSGITATHRLTTILEHNSKPPTNTVKPTTKPSTPQPTPPIYVLPAAPPPTPPLQPTFPIHILPITPIPITSIPTTAPITIKPSPPPKPPICSIEIAVSKCTIGGSSVDCSSFRSFLTPDNCNSTDFNWVYNVTNTGSTPCIIDLVVGKTLVNLAPQLSPHPLTAGKSSQVVETFNQDVCNGARLAFLVLASAHVFPKGKSSNASTIFTQAVPPVRRPPTPSPSATLTPSSTPTPTPVCNISIAVSSCTLGSLIECNNFKDFLAPDTCRNVEIRFTYKVTNTGNTPCNIDSVIGETLLNLVSEVDRNPIPVGWHILVKESFNQNVCNGSVITFPITATAHVFPNGSSTSAVTSFSLTLPGFTHAPTPSPSVMPPTLTPTSAPVCKISIAVKSCTLGGSLIDCNKFNDFVTPENCPDIEFRLTYNVTNTGSTLCDIDTVTGATLLNLASQVDPDPLPIGQYILFTDAFNQNVCNGSVINVPIAATAHLFPSGSPTSASTIFSLTLPAFTRSPTPSPSATPTSKPTTAPICSISIAISTCTFGGSLVNCSQFDDFLTLENCASAEFDLKYNVTNTGNTLCGIDSVKVDNIRDTVGHVFPNPLPAGTSSLVFDFFRQNVCSGAAINALVVAKAHAYPNGTSTSASTRLILTLPALPPTPAPTVALVCTISIAVNRCTMGGTKADCSRFNSLITADNCAKAEFNIEYVVSNTGHTPCNLDSVTGATLNQLVSQVRPNPLPGGRSSLVIESFNQSVCNGANIYFAVLANAHAFPNGKPVTASTSFSLKLPAFTHPPSPAPTITPVCNISITVSKCSFGDLSVNCSRFNDFVTADNCANVEFDVDYNISNTGLTFCEFESVVTANTLQNLAFQVIPDPLPPGKSSLVSDVFKQNLCTGSDVDLSAVAIARFYPRGKRTVASISFTMKLPTFTRRPTPVPSATPTFAPTCTISVIVAKCTFGGTSVDCSRFNNFITADNCATAAFDLIYIVSNTGRSSCTFDSVTGKTLNNLVSQVKPNPLRGVASKNVTEVFTQNVCNGAVIKFPVVATAHGFPNGKPTTAFTKFCLKLPVITRHPIHSPTPKPTRKPSQRPISFPRKPTTKPSPTTAYWIPTQNPTPPINTVLPTTAPTFRPTPPIYFTAPQEAASPAHPLSAVPTKAS